MGYNQSEYAFMNEFAVQMLPKKDPAMATVKKLERAVFDLKNMEKKSILLRGEDNGSRVIPSTSFRSRLYRR